LPITKWSNWSSIWLLKGMGFKKDMEKVWLKVYIGLEKKYTGLDIRASP